MSRNSKHPDLSPARIKRDQKDVKKVKDTIDAMFVNPFEEVDLISLTSGVAPSAEVTDQLLDAEMLGENALLKFQQERLESNEVDFFATLNRLNLGTFTKLLKKRVKMSNGKEAQFSIQSNIFGKIALIQQFHPLDLKEVFCFPLGPVPWSLAESDGALSKTTKSSLMHHLEKGVSLQQSVKKPFAAVIDGMALVRKNKPTGHTYDSYADHLLSAAIATSSNASRIDIVFDVYRENSIKDAERGNRESGKLEVKRIVGAQKVKQFSSLLSNGSNKMTLIRFLVSRWQREHACIGATQIYVGFNETCIKLGDREEPALFCNHEEADTRLVFHTKQISNSFGKIVIHTPDTDVLLIALGLASEISAELFMKTGVKSKTRIVSLEGIKDSLKTRYEVTDVNQASKALLGLHGFTGCDTISSFAGKGKVKPVKTMMKNQTYIDLFASFGVTPELSEVQFTEIQKFVCDLYGHQDDNTNTVRYKMYAAKHGHLDPKSIPPCADSLRQHSLRASYQVHIWRKSLESHPIIPSPIGFGWDQNEEGDFIVSWNNVNPAPDEVLEMMFCTCSRKCVRGSCPCVDNSLKCTDACTNHSCDNFQSNEEIIINQDDDDDDDDDRHDESDTESSYEDSDVESDEEGEDDDDDDDECENVFI